MCWKMMCTQINKFGDHVSCCAKSGDIIIRHNSLRNLIDSIGTDAKLSPVLKKEGILGNTTGRRPGDVSFPEWPEGKGLAIDSDKSTCSFVSPFNGTLRMVRCDKEARKI